MIYITVLISIVQTSKLLFDLSLTLSRSIDIHYLSFFRLHQTQRFHRSDPALSLSAHSVTVHTFQPGLGGPLSTPSDDKSQPSIIAIIPAGRITHLVFAPSSFHQCRRQNQYRPSRRIRLSFHLKDGLSSPGTCDLPDTTPELAGPRH